ncbi:NAD-dependent epimerase/dehydratase family protein [Salinibacter sp.]|uniref:NAD-dependent epimerase/dehydratase family protein n=1 Tax=Salinibacter sp. TaxID=2065818 RepID=UPI0021E724C5|nr:NAD-dependent epimerase/dehydratase family protein [Salinibacter sp.]
MTVNTRGSGNGVPASQSRPPRSDLLSTNSGERISVDPIFEGDVDTEKTVVVCGAGGFIAGHLVDDLLRQGYSTVRAVDIKPPSQWFQKFDAADNRSLDLREKESCYRALEGADQVYNLAADMGGMGFIENNKALCMLSVRINTHLLMAARDMDVERYFYSSSACVYNQELQDTADVEPLAEEDAYPALAEDGYGWEKLFSERMCRHFREDFGVTARVARYHNVYGPFGTYDGGREKAPAALTRKAVEAKLSGDPSITIWGDGTQTRSFMYVDDCVDGTQRIMHSGITEPINLGSDELVTINELVDVIEKAVEVDLEREYDLTKPQGVDGRNSDNTKILDELGWEPPTALRDGMEVTAEWIEEQIRRHAEQETTSRFAVPH